MTADRLAILARKQKELTARLSRLEHQLSDPTSTADDEEIKMEAWDVRNQMRVVAREQRALQQRGAQ